ncbi:MAG: RNA polymerase sigma factor [Solirubrobacteraceae bacterium]|nr:RNA polymerase sigma factor [Solirubrobacteraceae bacterium]
MKPPQPSDRALALRTRDGDDRAFTTLVGRHRATLVRYVARRSRPDLAEDAVQEALAAAHAALLDGRVPTDVRAWLHTIAWRRALDLLRCERDGAPLDPDVVVSAASGPQDTVLRRAELDQVLAVWGDLPDRQRTALVLSVLEGRTITEIADALDVNAAAAKALVSRGRRALSERLHDADTGCEDVRGQLLVAAQRGVRLSGFATRHVRGCRECAQLHREMRRRRRAAALALIPVTFRDRVRDLVALLHPSIEPQVGSVAKLCAVACAGTIAAPGAAVVATAPVLPVPKTDHVAKPKPKQTPRSVERRSGVVIATQERRSAVAVVVATPAAPPATKPAVKPRTTVVAATAPEREYVAQVRERPYPRPVPPTVSSTPTIVAATATGGPPPVKTTSGGTDVLKAAPTE